MSAQQSNLQEMRDFFAEILPSQGTYCIASPSLNGKGFEHFLCQTFDEMAAKAIELDAQGRNAYHACASYTQGFYHDPQSGKKKFRTKENVSFAGSLWFEIDIGPDKAEKQKGYASSTEAGRALGLFLTAHALPSPMIIASGGGFHCYYPLEGDILKEHWLCSAEKFKRICECGTPGLLADPTRTADIASLLRPAGTHNWKPERNGAEVRVISRAPKLDFAQFSAILDQALAKIPKSNSASITTAATTAAPFTPEELEGMLAKIEPDRPRDTWWKILAGVADSYGESARAPLNRWSCGDLHSKTVQSYDLSEFNRQYSDILSRQASTTRKITIATPIRFARENGWVDPRIAKDSPDWLTGMNRKYAWIAKDASIYRIGTSDFIDSSRFKTQHDNQLVVPSQNAKPMGMGSAWLRNPGRRDHEELVFRPDDGRITTDNCLNEWRDYAIPPQRGDVRPFLDLLGRLIHDKASRHHALRWMAHIIQFPHIKQATALMIWSREQGVGKNLLFECLYTIIGSAHAAIIGQTQLNADFNGWAKNKIFVIGDEVSSTDKRAEADKLKGLVTGTTLFINEKYQPARELPNLMNFVFLSNHNDALFINDTDRRYCVAEASAGQLPTDIANKFVKWREGNGLSALRHFLESIDLRAYNPKAPAPTTEAKAQMIEDNRSDIERYLADLMASNVAHLLGRELATANELAQRFHRDTGLPTPSAKAITNAAKRLGAVSRQIRSLRTASKERVLTLANLASWQTQPEAALGQEMLKVLK